MKVALIADIPYGDTVKITNDIISELSSYGTKILVSKKQKKYIDEPELVSFGSYDNIIDDCNVMIVVGGDGTVTKHASDAAKRKKPILGINGGHLGFLSGLEKTEISHLRSLVEGKYIVNKRMALEATIKNKDGKIIYSDLCVNDALIGRCNSLRMIDVSAELDGRHLARHRADGIIVSTPTGSTAYSMSAGGPVVDPFIECIIFTPVCSHSLTARSIVCSSESTLVLRNTSDSNDPRPMSLVTDSREPVEIPYDCEVIIKKADTTVDFITIKKQGFYEILKEKMIERNEA